MILKADVLGKGSYVFCLKIVRFLKIYQTTYFYQKHPLFNIKSLIRTQKNFLNHLNFLI